MDILEIPFVGAYQLRKDLPLLLHRLQKGDDGMMVTQRGKPAAMLLSLKKYQAMKMLIEELEEAVKELANKEYMGELAKAEREIRSGKGQKAEEVFKELGI